MDQKKLLEQIDKNLQKKGWIFVGPILHYKEAWKDQAAVYKKHDKYIVSGIKSDGKTELNELISEKEAVNRTKESFDEIKRLMFKSIQ